MPSRTLLAIGLGLGGMMLVAAFWGLYAGTPSTQPCPDGSGTCAAQLPAQLQSPMILVVFAAGYACMVAALLMAFPSRLMAALVVVGLAGWALPSLHEAWIGAYGEISVGYFATFLIGAVAHVTMPAVAMRSAQKAGPLRLYPVLGLGVAGLAGLAAAQLLSGMAPAPLVAALPAFWGFGSAATALASQPWKLEL